MASDEFVGTGQTLSTMDWIRDFNSTEGDRIDFRLYDADVGTAGTQSFDFIGTGAFSGTAGELRYEFVDTSTTQNTVIYGDTDGDGLADFAVRLSGHHTLTDPDFILT